MVDESLFHPNPEVISEIEPIYKLWTVYEELGVASKSHQRQNLPGKGKEILCIYSLSAMCLSHAVHEGGPLAAYNSESVILLEEAKHCKESKCV